jgi:hypothetical protein
VFKFVAPRVPFRVFFSGHGPEFVAHTCSFFFKNCDFFHLQDLTFDFQSTWPAIRIFIGGLWRSFSKLAVSSKLLVTPFLSYGVWFSFVCLVASSSASSSLSRSGCGGSIAPLHHTTHPPHLPPTHHLPSNPRSSQPRRQCIESPPDSRSSKALQNTPPTPAAQRVNRIRLISFTWRSLAAVRRAPPASRQRRQQRPRRLFLPLLELQAACTRRRPSRQGCSPSRPRRQQANPSTTRLAPHHSRSERAAPPLLPTCLELPPAPAPQRSVFPLLLGQGW